MKYKNDYTPSLEEFEFWCIFNEAYDSRDFQFLLSAFWQTYHEVTM